MVTSLTDEPAHALIALHGVKSHAAIHRFRRRQPRRSLALVLSGTDIYPQPSQACIESMETADVLVVLHPRAIDDLPQRFRPKTRVIVQSAKRRVAPLDDADRSWFTVCVVGHLREVKDPLLTARASRLMPPESRLRVIQAGGVIEPEFAALARTEMAVNSRYQWLGEMDSRNVAGLMTASDLMVLSSRLEGGARVIGEALVHGCPVLASRIAAAEGLLGRVYPGLFPVGDVTQLAALMNRCETDGGFFQQLRRICAVKARQFDPEVERQALRSLVKDLVADDESPISNQT